MITQKPSVEQSWLQNVRASHIDYVLRPSAGCMSLGKLAQPASVALSPVRSCPCPDSDCSIAGGKVVSRFVRRCSTKDPARTVKDWTRAVCKGPQCRPYTGIQRFTVHLCFVLRCHSRGVREVTVGGVVLSQRQDSAAALEYRKWLTQTLIR